MSFLSFKIVGCAIYLQVIIVAIQLYRNYYLTSYTLSSMKYTHFLFFSFFLLILFSCNDDDQIVVGEDNTPEYSEADLLASLTTDREINFFSVDYIFGQNSAIAASLIDSVEFDAFEAQLRIDFLRKHDNLGIVDNLVENYGWPIWKAVKQIPADNEAGFIYVIPFVDFTSNLTQSVLFAIPTSDDPFYSSYRDKAGYYYRNTTRAEIEESVSTDFSCDDTQAVFEIMEYSNFDITVFSASNTLFSEILDLCDDGFTTDDVVMFRDECSVTFVACVNDIAFAPEDEVELRNRECYEVIFSYECGGGGGSGSGSEGGGGGIGTGTIPGGIAGTSTTNPTNIGNGTGPSFESIMFANIIADCSNAASSDGGNSGGGAAGCSSFLDAIANLGENTLTFDVWLYMFNENQDLLDLAISIDPVLGMVFNSYVEAVAEEETSLSFRQFHQVSQAAASVQAHLSLNDYQINNLFSEAISSSNFAESTLLQISTLVNSFAVNSTQYNTSVVASLTYLGLLESPDDLSVFADLMSGDPAGDIWGIAQEIIIDLLRGMILEQLADAVPGGSLVSLGPEAIAAFREGRILDALWTSLDIMLNEADTFIPTARFLSASLATVDVYREAKKLIKPLKKLAAGGIDGAVNLYQALKDHTGSVGNVVQGWKSNITAANGNNLNVFEGIDNLDDFYDDFISRFNPVGSFTYNGSLVYKMYQFADGQTPAQEKWMYVTSYSTSSTTDPSTGLSFPKTLKFYKGPGSFISPGTNPNSSPNFSTIFTLRFR